MSEEILSDQEMVRYCRQILLPSFDIDGQEALKQSKVLVLGVGGLGCAAAQYLGAAGVGHLTLVDFDRVELSNLQRQILHGQQDIGVFKADSGRDSLAAINPDITVEAVCERLDETALAALCQQQDLVVDCCDNLATRELLNRICHQAKIPLVSGAAIRMEGILTSFDYRDGSPCYQCLSQLFGEQQLSCMEAGVLSPLVGMVGSMQAAEAIKLLTGVGRSLVGRVLLIDAATMGFREMKLAAVAGCPVCGSTE